MLALAAVPAAQAQRRHVERLLEGDDPVVAATDYVRAWPQLIAEYVAAPYITLGTDGFGRSATRPELRRFFDVDAQAIASAALQGLHEAGRLSGDDWRACHARLDLPAGQAPWRS